MQHLIFKLEGGIVPKARPRGTAKGHHYLPKDYRQWKNSAIESLRSQFTGDTIFDPVRVKVLLSGKHNRQGDTDNVIGSILDALVQAKILVDDNMAHVVEIAIRLEHSKAEPTATIWIESGFVLTDEQYWRLSRDAEWVDQGAVRFDERCQHTPKETCWIKDVAF